MVGPETPGAAFLSRFERELFIPRNARGETNEAALDFADEVANAFSRYPCFVGVTLRGSNIRGYSTPDSDIDVNIWYDSKDPAYTVDDLDLMFGKLNTMKRNKKLDVHIRWCDMRGESGDVADLVGSQRPYAALCELTFGPRIEEYRTKLAGNLKRLDPERRSEALRRILIDLLYYETTRVPDMKDRIPEFRNLSAGELERIMNKRKTMWEARIREVFEIPKP